MQPVDKLSVAVGHKEAARAETNQRRGTEERLINSRCDCDSRSSDPLCALAVTVDSVLWTEP